MTELVLTLNEDDYAYLELESEELAISPTAVVAMLVRKARKASERPALNIDEAVRLADEVAAKEAARQRAIAEKKARLLAELESLEDGEADVAAEAQESLSLPEFNEALLREPELDPIARAVSVAPRRNTTSVGSMTAPVGLRPDLAGGNDVMGDAAGNIVRRNFRHLMK